LTSSSWELDLELQEMHELFSVTAKSKQERWKEEKEHTTKVIARPYFVFEYNVNELRDAPGTTV
jgi:hypothetical protein